MNNKKIIITLLLFTIAIASRLLPHQPNFAAVGAVTIIATIHLSLTSSLIITISSLLISDSILGFHHLMPWVYGAYVLTAIITYFTKNNKLSQPFISSSLFFIITNFGVWLTTNMYSPNISGLINCYNQAIPFFRNTFSSDLIYFLIINSALNINIHKIPKQISALIQKQNKQLIYSTN
jgi:hypothetical protein